MDYRDKIKKYFEEEKRIIDMVNPDELNTFINMLEETRKAGHRIFIFGNGGSGATASHFACDYTKGVNYYAGLNYDFECLNDNIPTMLAVSNDIGYADLFVYPLQFKLHEGDMVIGISGSGNSENVLRAVDYANSKGGKTFALVGYDGGKLKKLAQHSIHIAIDNMQIVEDLHMIVDHVSMYVLTH